MTYDKRFTCPECGRAPLDILPQDEMLHAGVRDSSHRKYLFNGALHPGGYTCIQDHNWTVERSDVSMFMEFSKEDRPLATGGIVSSTWFKQADWVARAKAIPITMSDDVMASWDVEVYS